MSSRWGGGGGRRGEVGGGDVTWRGGVWAWCGACQAGTSSLAAAQGALSCPHQLAWPGLRVAGQVAAGLGLLRLALCDQSWAQRLAASPSSLAVPGLAHRWEGTGRDCRWEQGRCPRGPLRLLSPSSHCWSSPSNSRISCNCQRRGIFCPSHWPAPTPANPQACL